MAFAVDICPPHTHTRGKLIGKNVYYSTCWQKPLCGCFSSSHSLSQATRSAVRKVQHKLETEAGYCFK